MLVDGFLRFISSGLEGGFNVGSDAVLDALKAAWLQLNLKQIAAGVKEPEVYVPPEEQNG